MNQIPIIKGLKEIYKNYDTFILDQWGVMHDGIKGYKKAIQCINQLNKEKKNLLIISNSSKRNYSTSSRLPSLGFNRDHFQEIMTSGEMIWQSLVKENYKETKNLGKNCFYIYDETKQDAKKYLEDLEKFNLVKDIHKADFILGCTPFLNKKVIDFYPLLKVAKNKNLPFICANPDFDTVQNNSKKLVFCMGAIAELYKNMGGKIFILGKPSIDIYYEVTKKMKKITKSKILAIGDSLYHDIQGAINFGIDSLLITSTGIHKDHFDFISRKEEYSNNIIEKIGIKPTFICSDLNF